MFSHAQIHQRGRRRIESTATTPVLATFVGTRRFTCSFLRILWSAIVLAVLLSLVGSLAVESVRLVLWLLMLLGPLQLLLTAAITPANLVVSDALVVGPRCFRSG